MTYFQWISDIELGHSEIDAQHKQLLLLGEALVEPLINSAAHEHTAVRLQELIDFAREHFAFEEELMRAAGFPGVDKHANFHTSLLAELRTYCFKVQRGLHTNPAGLISFVWHWIVLHIGSEDRDLVVWLKSQDPDGRG